MTVCQFSCMLDVGSPDNVKRAIQMREEMAAEMDRDDGSYLGFEMESEPPERSSALWIHSHDTGEPDHVVAFVLRCAEAFNLSGCWGFHWVFASGTPRLDDFGGGAQLIDLGKRQSVDWIDCEHWLAGGLAGRAVGAATATLISADERAAP